MSKKDEAMKLALEHAKRDERHMNHAETRYWCRMYRDIAEKAIEALAEQPAQHKPLSEPEERKAFEMYWQAKHDNRRYCESAFEGWKARATPQPAQQEPLKRWTEAEHERAYRNSPELHKDVKSLAAFKRVAKEIAAMYGIKENT